MEFQQRLEEGDAEVAGHRKVVAVVVEEAVAVELGKV